MQELGWKQKKNAVTSICKCYFYLYVWEGFSSNFKEIIKIVIWLFSEGKCHQKLS